MQSRRLTARAMWVQEWRDVRVVSRFSGRIPVGGRYKLAGWCLLSRMVAEEAGDAPVRMEHLDPLSRFALDPHASPMVAWDPRPAVAEVRRRRARHDAWKRGRLHRAP